MQIQARFERLYCDNFEFVWAAVRGAGAPAKTVDTLAGGVFVSAYQRQEELSWEVSARSWLYRLTHEALARSGIGRAKVVQGDAARRLDLMLEGLRPQSRQLLTMAERLGMNAQEIASELSIPAQTVHERLLRARTRLSKNVGADAALDAVRREDQPPARAQQDIWNAIGPAIAKSGTGYVRPEPSSWVTRIFFAVGAGALIFVGASLVMSIDVGHEPEEVEDLTVLPGKPAVANAGVGPANSALFPEVKAADERKLLEDAEAALGTDRPSAALRSVQVHAASFPNSPLAQSREITRARALCQLGRAEEGLAAANAVLAAYPDSVKGLAARAQCKGASTEAVAAPEASTLATPPEGGPKPAAPDTAAPSRPETDKP